MQTTLSPRGILSGVLVNPIFDKFFRVHEKVRWELAELDFSTIDTSLLSDDDVTAVRTAMLVESHYPVYTLRLLEYFRADHEMTAFVTSWAYEEMKHHLVLRAYLEATGLVDPDQLNDELAVTRGGAWGEEYMSYTRAQLFTHTMLQELIAALFYKRFAATAKEPLLKIVLGLVSKDEYRHCAYYLDKGRQELAENKKALDEVDRALFNFEMPGPSFVPDYAQRYEVMLGVAKVDFKAIEEALGKIAQLTGKAHILKLATSSEFRRIVRAQWGLEPRQAFFAGLTGI